MPPCSSGRTTSSSRPSPIGRHLTMWYVGDDADGNPPARTLVEVYRLAGLQAGIDAFRTIRARPDWAEWSAEGTVDTKGLTRVVRAKLRVEPYQGNSFIRLPEALDAGWYLVQLPDKTHPSQAVLQVTDVAGYLAISETRTAGRANDLASGDPVQGATATVGATTMGTTDADGLTLSKTPAALLPDANQDCEQPCDAVVAVQAPDGRAVFLPASSDHEKFESFGDSYYGADGDRSFWALLHSDRGRYRPTDIDQRVGSRPPPRRRVGADVGHCPPDAGVVRRRHPTAGRDACTRRRPTPARSRRPSPSLAWRKGPTRSSWSSDGPSFERRTSMSGRS